MYLKVIFLLCCFLVKRSSAQTGEPWIRFYDTTTELSGYKDKKGRVKIPARFEGFTRADSFYNIIAVTEKIDTSYRSYYLLKDGRKVAQDSVFMFDFTYDCESEGKIFFYDKKKDRVGFLNGNGAAIIPAVYNAATPFRNGLAVALKDAKRSCWEEKEDTLHCEHLGWSGGATVLINDRNEVLVDSLKEDLGSIDWFSLKINDPAVDTSIYISIQANNGNSYSFIDYEKEFKKWFHRSFLPLLKRGKGLPDALFTKLVYWSEQKGWTALSKSSFLKSFPGLLTAARFQPNALKELSISQETGDPFMIESDLFKQYYDACGAHNRYRFPAFTVMFTYYKKRGNPLTTATLSDFYKTYETDYQEHFLFLRTGAGYKLLQASWKR